MADVRSMLRAERASRHITHPNASYTRDGKLLCNLCETLVKSEAAWQAHLHSTGHTLRLGRAQEAAATRLNDTTSKKRKASTLENSPVAERKRTKPVDSQLSWTDRERSEEAELKDTDIEPQNDDNTSEPAAAGHVASANGQQLVLPTHQLPQPDNSAPAPADINDDEIAAFERDLAAMEAVHNRAPATALDVQATISAAPVRAEDVAAQAREEQSAQRGKRDAEIEEEREEAARLLQEEFDEMASLEERVRKLRDKREALRKESTEASNRTEVTAALSAELPADGEAVIEEEEDDEDEDDDYDDWAFGRPS